MFLSSSQSSTFEMNPRDRSLWWPRQVLVLVSAEETTRFPTTTTTSPQTSLSSVPSPAFTASSHHLLSAQGWEATVCSATGMRQD